MNASVVVGMLISAMWLDGAQRPVFRAVTHEVVVDVSVKKGNVPVTGLRAADFRLTDSGVPQQPEIASLQDVPLDISILLDTSGSTAGALQGMVDNIGRITDLLNSGDRFRVLTIGLSVFHAVRWTEAGKPIPPVAIFPMSEISLVYDGLYAAVTHVVEPTRRHVVVAMTDGADVCSLIRPDQIRALARRTEAIVHWVEMGGGDALRMRTVTTVTAGAACVGGTRRDLSVLVELAEGTGGGVHPGSDDIAGLFRGILADYRQSYVLRYTPEGVPQTGWHPLAVTVVSGKYTVRARSGYFGDEDRGQN